MGTSRDTVIGFRSRATAAEFFNGLLISCLSMIGPNGIPGEFRTVPCPLCGAAEHIIVHRGLTDLLLHHPGTFSIRECRNCQMQSLDPQPVGATLAAYYMPANGATYPDNRERPAKNLKPILRWALHHLRGYPAPVDSQKPAFLGLRAGRALRKSNDCYRYVPYSGQGHLLDVGCGSGEYVRTMSQLGWKAEGLSMVESEGSHTNNDAKAHIHTGRIQDLSSAKLYDAITLWHVLEHLPEPRADLEHLRRLLAPGGVLGIGIPVMDSVEAQLLGTAWMGYEIPRHLLFFTRQRLRQFLSDSGFDVLSMHSEPRTRSFERSLPRAKVDFVTRLLLSRKWILRKAMRQWVRLNINGMIVVWARRSD